MSSKRGGGCLGSTLGGVLALGIVLWFLMEPQSFEQVFLQAGRNLIELVKGLAPMIVDLIKTIASLIAQQTSHNGG